MSEEESPDWDTLATVPALLLLDMRSDERGLLSTLSADILSFVDDLPNVLPLGGF